MPGDGFEEDIGVYAFLGAGNVEGVIVFVAGLGGGAGFAGRPTEA